MVEIKKIFNQSVFEAELKQVKDKVRFILKNNRYARNDNVTLLFVYWQKFDALDEDRFKCINSVYMGASDLLNIKYMGFTSPESILRARRDLCSDDHSLRPDVKTEAERQERAEGYRRAFRGS